MTEDISCEEGHLCKKGAATCRSFQKGEKESLSPKLLEVVIRKEGEMIYRIPVSYCPFCGTKSEIPHTYGDRPVLYHDVLDTINWKEWNDRYHMD